jgi:GT2 family glycosyltransferase
MTQRPTPFPLGLLMTPVSRRPTRLPEETVAAVLAADVTVQPGSVAAPAPGGTPEVSVVVVTMNNHVFLKLCLTSVLANTSSPVYEVIVVDNGSSDASVDYLRDLSARHSHVKVIRNESNLGFGPATNQGLAVATGDVLVLLNDDTVVPPRWLAHLCEHVKNPSIGLLGPVTNRAGGESQIPSAYRTYGEFLRFARQRRESNRAELLDVPMLTMFCVAMRRDVFDRVGPLDEQFAIGMFEDDDYARRVRDLGYRVVCVEDVFIHHFGATSLGKLAAAGELGLVFDANRRRFEAKWQTEWTPRRCRTAPEYDKLIGRIQSTIGGHVPPGSQVAVLSRGDDNLLDLAGRPAVHFPQTADGAYAGHHPGDSVEALRQLSAIQAAGAEYLLIPQTMRWWLDFYLEFGRHLASRCRLVVDNDAFVLFDLRDAGSVN